VWSTRATLPPIALNFVCEVESIGTRWKPNRRGRSRGPMLAAVGKDPTFGCRKLLRAVDRSRRDIIARTGNSQNAHWRPRVSHRVILAPALGKKSPLLRPSNHFGAGPHNPSSTLPESRSVEGVHRTTRVCLQDRSARLIGSLPEESPPCTVHINFVFLPHSRLRMRRDTRTGRQVSVAACKHLVEVYQGSGHTRV